MTKLKPIIWTLILLFVLIGIGASINQLPPKHTNNRFDEFPIQTLFHVVPAILFLVIGCLQLIPKFRKARPKLHKVLGWIFFVSGISIAITALTIVYIFPYSGVMEQIPITLFALLLLFFLLRGVWFATQKRIVKHRKDVLRVLSLGLGASMFRVQLIPAIIMAFDPKIIVPYLFWFSFGGMLLLCESYFIFSVKKIKKN